MASFEEILRRSKVVVTRLVDYTGVPHVLANNIFHYSKCLVNPANPNTIEEKVFYGQMGLRFGITSKYHLQLMFESLRETKTLTRYIPLEVYARTICTFFSPSLDVKIDFVFNVYNFNRTGHITVPDITQMLRSCILPIGEDDANEQLKELVELVLNVVDTNCDGLVSLEEFREFVKHDILCLELFGKVLPKSSILHSFRQLVEEKTPLKIKEFFDGERKKCLSEPNFSHSKTAALFPGVVLDLP